VLGWLLIVSEPAQIFAVKKLLAISFWLLARTAWIHAKGYELMAFSSSPEVNGKGMSSTRADRRVIKIPAASAAKASKIRSRKAGLSG